MVNPKKRLEEIINKCIKNCLYRKNVSPSNYEIYENENIDQATTKILKEFVHKDNLPSIEKIANSLYYDCPRKYKNSNLALSAWQDALDILAKAIRKLIEGKK